ncbi:RagB/SusD family nutrient uptake outer membrane protein [Robertkochia aurantiaca]|uniref:RagB/SusD family nutrient uptake outer membrane protein n=1 Tax=Robertkochia aurantiaca TaxID=2873700 RepID=UPI001CCD55C3|nr:RagB/SusD family nutrient uptake outer membrane protein [Robertkochia sp. 3YJGBD-33]
MKKIIYTTMLSLGMVTLFPSCETDFENPNAPRVEAVSESTESLLGLVVGLEYQYTIGGASGLYNAITGSGFTAGELELLNAGNAPLANLLDGGTTLTPGNSVVTNLWTNLQLVRENAQTVIDNSVNAGTEAQANGIKAYGHFYKGLAIGTMAQFWEQGVIETAEDAPFVSRDAALAAAIASLEQAASLSNSGVPAEVTNAVGSQIDLNNAAQALIARYSLMAGDNAAAIAAAQAVDKSSTSVFIFDAVSPNPVFRSSLNTNNVFDVIAAPAFGLDGELAADPADQRIPFYLEANADNGKGFFTGDAASIPVYLPGEIDLILAEAYARQDQTQQAVDALNAVLTKTPEASLFGLGAGLPAYSGATDQASLLTEIYKNRCIELYMSGMKFEDSRRFGRPGPNDANSERNRNWYPYPNLERDNNPNTPTDPAI